MRRKRAEGVVWLSRRQDLGNVGFLLPEQTPDMGRGGEKGNFLQMGDQRRNMEDVGKRGKKGAGGRIDLSGEEPRVSQPELPLLMYNRLIPIRRVICARPKIASPD